MRQEFLSDESKKLLKTLEDLKRQLQDYSWATFKRLNPFCENLTGNWKEKGSRFGGQNITIYDSTTVVGDVTIGDNTWIGPFCSLDGTGILKIGTHCSISAGTHIQTHDTVKWALSGGVEPYEYKPVQIGNNCFIGVNAVILAGITIGNRCVIGAGAVVTKSIPDNTIVAGVPAKPIGTVPQTSQEPILAHES